MKRNCHKVTPLSLLTLGLFCVVGVAHATDSPPALTLGKAVGLAMDRYPTVMEAREHVKEADAAISFVVSQVFPNISAQGNASYNKSAADNPLALFGAEPYNQYFVNLSFNQPIYQGGALWAGLMGARKEKQVQEMNLDLAQRDLTYSVLQSFYGILFQQRQLETFHDAEDVLKQTMTVSERYYHIGRTQLVDLLQIKTKYALLAAQIAKTENDLQTAAAHLAILLRENQARQLKVVGKLQPVDRKVISNLILEKKRELTEIRRSNTILSEFEDRREVAMSGDYPKLNLSGQWGRVDYAKSQLLDDNATQWTIGLNLTIPIFTGLSSFHQKAILASQEAELQFQQQGLFDQLSFNQVQVEKNLDAAQAVLVSTQQASEFATQSLKEAQKDYKLQRISSLQFQTSQSDFLTAKTAYNQAVFDNITALANYFVSTGIPLSELVTLLESG